MIDLHLLFHWHGTIVAEEWLRLKKKSRVQGCREWWWAWCTPRGNTPLMFLFKHNKISSHIQHKNLETLLGLLPIHLKWSGHTSSGSLKLILGLNALEWWWNFFFHFKNLHVACYCKVLFFPIFFLLMLDEWEVRSYTMLPFLGQSLGNVKKWRWPPHPISHIRALRPL